MIDSSGYVEWWLHWVCLIRRRLWPQILKTRQKQGTRTCWKCCNASVERLALGIVSQAISWREKGRTNAYQKVPCIWFVNELLKVFHCCCVCLGVTPLTKALLHVSWPCHRLLTEFGPYSLRATGVLPEFPGLWSLPSARPFWVVVDSTRPKDLYIEIGKHNSLTAPCSFRRLISQKAFLRCSLLEGHFASALLNLLLLGPCWHDYNTISSSWTALVASRQQSTLCVEATHQMSRGSYIKSPNSRQDPGGHHQPVAARETMTGPMMRVSAPHVMCPGKFWHHAKTRRFFVWSCGRVVQVALQEMQSTPASLSGEHQERERTMTTMTPLPCLNAIHFRATNHGSPTHAGLIVNTPSITRRGLAKEVHAALVLLLAIGARFCC